MTTDEFFAFWRAVEAVGGERDLGLRMGSEVAPHQQHVASMASLHSPNLGEALKRMARYKRLVCPEQITIEVVRGEARLRFEWLLAGEAPPRLLIDSVFASVARLARTGTGKPIGPRRIELARRRADEPMLRRHFGCDVRFDAPIDLFVLDAKALDEPFVTHNAELLEAIRARPRGRRSTVPARVRSLTTYWTTLESARIAGERARGGEGGEGAGDEPAHAPATARGAGDELPGAARRRCGGGRRGGCSREYGSRFGGGGVPPRVRGSSNSFTRAFHAGGG